MKKLRQEIISFFKSQSFVIVSTIDKNGAIHNSAKGIITLSPNGRVYLLDVYSRKTRDNLKYNSRISITAIDEHKFKGYCLKGKASVLEHAKFSPQVLKAWDEKITSRITRRLLRNISGEKDHSKHPEAHLPKPAYMIVMIVEDIVDLTPVHLNGEI
jgi:general stress protein 26